LLTDFLVTGGENQGMNRKIKVLALISVVVVAVVAASLVLAMQSTVKADSNNAVASDAESTLSSINATNISGFFNNEYMGFGGPRGMGQGFGGFGGPEGSGGFGSIQVSSDFTQNVTNIAKSDSDVQNLLNQGYNITSVRPVISTVVDGNGNVVTKASTADVILQSTTGRAFVVVDLDQAKVTKIVTLTATEIDK
jgi:hypothetical protein